MRQLTFEFSDEPRAVIPFSPQPIQNHMGCVFRGDWVWWHGLTGGTSTNDPTRSEGFLQASPYQINGVHDGLVIRHVSVQHTRQDGWVWVLRLSPVDYEKDPPETFWALHTDKPRPTSCEHCLSQENANHPLLDVPPIKGFNTYSTCRTWVLCEECKEEHEGYWKRVLASCEECPD